MKLALPTGTAQTKTALNGQKSVKEKSFKVCMHVVRKGRTDVRAIRAATALVEAGYEVCLLDVENEHDRPSAETLHNVSMKHIMIPDWQTTMRVERLFFIRALQVFVLSIIQLWQTRADIYHASELTALPATYIVSALRRKPLIFESYELPPPETSIGFWRRLERPLTAMLAFMLPRCAGVIAVSSPIGEQIRKRFHVQKVSLIRNVPFYQAVPKSDRLRQYLGLGPDIRIALYQGMLSADRGLDRLIRAANFLAEDIVIVMMGEGAETTKAELRTLITSEGVAHRVKIIPAVPYEELLDWTSSADLGLTLFPPDYSMSIRFSLPNKLFEYLMAGLPVLSTQLDAIIEVLNTYDVGRVVPSLAPADVGSAINAMLADTASLKQMHDNALRAAKECCWEKERQKLVQLYRAIMDE